MTNGERQTKGRGRLFDSVVETVGDTPCIRINNLAPKNATIYVKAEFFNPAGSVKDRLALSIIETAEHSGTLKPGQTVVEATSGNTGIGLAPPKGIRLSSRWPTASRSSGASSCASSAPR